MSKKQTKQQVIRSLEKAFNDLEAWHGTISQHIEREGAASNDCEHCLALEWMRASREKLLQEEEQAV